MFIHHLGTHRLGLHLWQLAGIALIRLLVIAVLVIAIVLVVRAFARRGVSGTSSAPTISPAEQVLDERFARGEIDAEEYQNRRRVLQDSPHW
ncbi:MAG: SHOCT domain-containing protein [Actinoplanes sp.]